MWLFIILQKSAKAFDDAHYRQLIIDHLKQFGKASRANIKSLLFDVLTSDQKEHSLFYE